MVTGAGRLWRLSLLVPFWGAASSFFQWRDKTCVALAGQDSRRLGDKVEKIEDATELAQMRRQARQVQFKVFGAALSLTPIALVLPSLG